MGVKACDRSGCEEIMCDQLVLENYLCPECFSELRERLAVYEGLQRTTEESINESIRQFLRTKPNRGRLESNEAIGSYLSRVLGDTTSSRT